jgi:hypothetical protein
LPPRSISHRIRFTSNWTKSGSLEWLHQSGIVISSNVGLESCKPQSFLHLRPTRM